MLDAEPQVEHGLAHGETPPEPCVIGSVKTHVGHLEAAAGIASLIKAVLSMRHERVPAQLHFQRLNHHCSLDGSRLEIAAAARAWPRAKRRFAGVSSFGFGGTLAHLVLADAADMADEARTHEAAPIPAPACEPAVAPLLVWSAKTPEALERMTDRLAARLRERDATPAELAFSLQTGRSALPHRRALVCAATDDAQQIAGWLTARDPARLVEQLAHARARPVPVFMFPGQGAQRIGMARGLYRELPGFRAPFDACADGFAAHLGLDLRELLFAPEPGDAGQDAAPAARLESTALAQPALFALDYALARCLIGLGIRPAAMIGHSLGEYVAACLAGVFSLEDALAIVALRGRLMQDLPAGAMASVGLGEAELAESLGEGLSLAAVNGAARCVVAGESARVDALLAALEARGVPCRRLRVSHAFHSAMMEPAREPLREALSRITLRAPTLPFVSNLTGDWIRDEEAVDPGYWARHLREPVRFADGLATLRERLGDATLLLEVGPGGTLQGFARQQQPDAALPALALMPAPGSATEARDCLGVLARLWAAGCEPDWPALHRGAPPRRVSLPAYPFDRRRHWLRTGGRCPAFRHFRRSRFRSGIPDHVRLPPQPVFRRRRASCRSRVAGFDRRRGAASRRAPRAHRGRVARTGGGAAAHRSRAHRHARGPARTRRRFAGAGAGGAAAGDALRRGGDDPPVVRGTDQHRGAGRASGTARGAGLGRGAGGAGRGGAGRRGCRVRCRIGARAVSGRDDRIRRRRIARQRLRARTADRAAARPDARATGLDGRRRAGLGPERAGRACRRRASAAGFGFRLRLRLRLRLPRRPRRASATIPMPRWPRRSAPTCKASSPISRAARRPRRRMRASIAR